MKEMPRVPEWQVDAWFNTQALKLEQLRGRVVLLHAFQMLCPGCVSHALPQAERVHREYAGLGVVVIGLHTVFEHHAAMRPVALEAFLQEYRLTHPVGVDSALPSDPIPVTMRRYGMRGTPTLMLIDRAGILRFHEFGRVDDLRLGVELGRLLNAAPSKDPEFLPNVDSPAQNTGCDEVGCGARRLG